MTSRLRRLLPLALVLTLAQAVPAGAETETNLVQWMQKRYKVPEFKRLVDATPLETLNRQVDDQGRNALAFAAATGSEQSVLLLLLAGANPNTRDHAGRTPAFAVVGNPREDYQTILEMLLLARADPRATDNEGNSLLALATESGNLAAAKLLFLRGASPTPKNVPGNRQPLFIAREKQNAPLVALFEGRSSSETIPMDKAFTVDRALPLFGQGATRRFMLAAVAGRTVAINNALLSRADINHQGEGGNTALFRAVRENRPATVAILLLDGANPNIELPEGNTPLIESMRIGNISGRRMTFELLMAGAEVNAVAENGMTALSMSAHYDNPICAEWMIWRGASFDVHSMDGTVMQAAKRYRDREQLVSLLKSYGVPDDPPLYKPYAAMFEAVIHRDIRAVQAELDAGVPVDAPDEVGHTPLEFAVYYDAFDIVDLLLKRGANINPIHGKNRWHPLHNLAMNKERDSTNTARKMAALVARGGDPNVLLEDGTTPLMLAALAGETGPKMEFLIKVTTDVGARNRNGLTAVGVARKHGQTEAMKMLQEHGFPE